MKDCEFQNLAKYLQERRLALGFTQAALSKKLKVHVQYVSNWERGMCIPPTHSFDKVLEILKVDREQVVKAMVLDSKVQIEEKVFQRKKVKKVA